MIVFLFLSITNVQAQIWKKIIKIAVNPIGYAAGAGVSHVTHNPVINAIVNPDAVVINHALPLAQQAADFTGEYISAVIKTGNWKTIIANTFNPWFIQTVYGVNIARQKGWISNKTDCKEIGKKIATGIAIAAGINTGDPGTIIQIDDFSTNFNEAACDVSFNINVNNIHDGIGTKPPSIPNHPAPLLQGNPYGLLPTSNFDSIPTVGIFKFDDQDTMQLLIKSDGNIYYYHPNGPKKYPSSIAGILFFDASLKYVFIFTLVGLPNWFGIDKDDNLFNFDSSKEKLVGKLSKLNDLARKI